MRREAWPGLRVYDVLQCRGQARPSLGPQPPSHGLARPPPRPCPAYPGLECPQAAPIYLHTVKVVTCDSNVIFSPGREAEAVCQRRGLSLVTLSE